MGWVLAIGMLSSHALAFVLGFWVGLTRRNGGPPGSEGGGEVVRMGQRAALLLALSVGLSGVAMAADPQGVRLRPSEGVTGEPMLIPWGAASAQVEAAIGVAVVPRRGAPLFDARGRANRPMPGLLCEAGPDDCRTFGWQADFGPTPRGLEPHLLFAGDKLYGYVVTLDAEQDFEAVSAVLKNALGPPSVVEEAPVQNRMGATFTSQAVAWKTSSTVVRLVSRVVTVDDCVMSVTYLPLAPPEKPDETRVPF
jgi:hypothetical protein